MAMEHPRSATRDRGTATVLWGRMSIFALLLVVTSFAWLGILLNDRVGSAGAPSIASTGGIRLGRDVADPEAVNGNVANGDVVNRAPPGEAKQPAAADEASVDVATRRAADAQASAPRSAPDSASGSATLANARDASDSAPGDGKAETQRAGTPPTTDPPAAEVRQAHAPEGVKLPPSRPADSIEAASVSGSLRTSTSPSTRRGSPPGESRRVGQPPEGKPGVLQQQWALLRPPTQPSPARAGPIDALSSEGIASRRVRTMPATSPVEGVAGDSPGRPEEPDAFAAPRGAIRGGIAESNGQSNPAPATLDSDPSRREQWLRDQLQIR